MLQGNLTEFSLRDILHLLASTAKSGTLRLRSDGHEGRVVFGDGRVRAAVSSSTRLLVGRRLLGTGQVSAPALRDALDGVRDHADVGEDVALARALVASGAVGEDTCRELLAEQVHDAMVELLSWHAGRFRFEVGDQPADPLESPASVDDLLAEVERQIQERDGLRQRAPHRDAVVTIALDRGPGDEVTLSGEMLRVLAFVDGRRTAGELAELLGQGELRAARTLVRLVDAGLVEVHTGGGDSAVDQLLSAHAALTELEYELPPPAGDWDDVGAAAADSAGPAPEEDEAAVTAPEDAAAETEEPVAAAEPEAPVETPPSGAPAGPDDADVAAEPTVADAAAADAAEETPPAHEDEREAVAVGAQAADGNGTRRRPTPSRLSTDPTIDETLVKRLIDGVRDL